MQDKLGRTWTVYFDYDPGEPATRDNPGSCDAFYFDEAYTEDGPDGAIRVDSLRDFTGETGFTSEDILKDAKTSADESRAESRAEARADRDDYESTNPRHWP